MKKLLLLSFLIYSLLFTGLATLNGSVLVLVIPFIIYLGAGIYADLTLVYRGGRFQPLPWTYPDYAADDLRGFLEGVRRRYLRELKNRSG